jgi:hypothetical protein
MTGNLRFVPLTCIFTLKMSCQLHRAGCLPPMKQVGECDTILTVTLHIVLFILLLMSFYVLHISSRLKLPLLYLSCVFPCIVV